MFSYQSCCKNARGITWNHWNTLTLMLLTSLYISLHFTTTIHLHIVHITMFAHGNPEDYIDLKPHTESNKLTRLTSLYGWNLEGFCYVAICARATGRDLVAFSRIEVRLNCLLASIGDGVGRSSITCEMFLCYGIKAHKSHLSGSYRWPFVLWEGVESKTSWIILECMIHDSWRAER